MKTLSIRKKMALAAASARLWAVAAGALLVCAAVSCKKDGGSEPTPVYGVRTFHATSEGHAGDGKTTLAGNVVNWETGDAVAVQGDEDSAPVEFTTETNGASSADFECAEEESVNGSSFYAIYPASAAAANGIDKNTGKWSVRLPKYQVSKGGTFGSGANPMAGVSENKESILFRNLCGVLRFKLRGDAGTRVLSIRVEPKDETEQRLWGDGEVEFKDDGSVSLGGLSGGDRSVCLVCPGGVNVGGGEVEFDIVLPGGSLVKGFTADVYCETASGSRGVFVMTAKNNTGRPTMIERNKITEMDALVFSSANVEEGVLPGWFTVDEGGTKVRFSNGNLRCDKVSPNASWSGNNLKWSFARNQYDVVENGNVSVGYGNQTAIGLFGWGTTGHDYRNDIPNDPESGKTDYDYCYEPWRTLNSNDYGPKYQGDVNGDDLRVDTKSDWGCNLSDGSKTWHTPSTSEWTHLLNGRNIMGNVGYTNLSTGVEIDGATYNGLFVYPDGYGGAAVGQEGGPASWGEIDAAGVVFLPCAGYRFTTSVDYVGSRGNYWSSTASSTETQASSLLFHVGNVDPMLSNNRCRGVSVRLVR